jgi:hypothetical protein
LWVGAVALSGYSSDQSDEQSVALCPWEHDEGVQNHYWIEGLWPEFASSAKQARTSQGSYHHALRAFRGDRHSSCRFHRWFNHRVLAVNSACDIDSHLAISSIFSDPPTSRTKTVSTRQFGDRRFFPGFRQKCCHGAIWLGGISLSLFLSKIAIACCAAAISGLRCSTSRINSSKRTACAPVGDLCLPRTTPIARVPLQVRRNDGCECRPTGRKASAFPACSISLCRGWKLDRIVNFGESRNGMEGLEKS